jgi:hypothetical protein
VAQGLVKMTVDQSLVNLTVAESLVCMMDQGSGKKKKMMFRDQAKR